jgi:drug/metabolite transporter (DMT)-like permease
VNTPALFAVLLIVDSLHFVFARALRPYLPAEMSSFLLLAIAAAQVGSYQLIRRDIHLAVLRRHWRFFSAIGLLVAASTVINYAAVNFIDPGTASLLGKTVVLFSLGFGLLWLHERLRPPELIGALLAIAGIFIISFQPGDYLRLGSVLVLASSFFYALHTAIVKRFGEQIDFGDFFFFRISVTAVFLFVYAAGRGQLVWPSPVAWALVIVAGTVDVVISRALYYLSLRRMPMSIHTIILTLSPVVTVLWSLFLFGEVPSAVSAIGGLFIILGVGLVTVWRNR